MLKEMLEFKCAAIESLHANPRYVAIERFILKHAALKFGQPLPTRFKKGKIKMCFKNASQLVDKHPELIYFEGFAIRQGIPIEIRHAWAEDKAGNVIEPTWLSPCSADQYMGVPIPPDLHACAVVQSHCYSFFWLGKLEIPNTEILPTLETYLQSRNPAT